jgi:hypothetical protein
MRWISSAHMMDVSLTDSFWLHLIFFQFNIHHRIWSFYLILLKPFFLYFNQRVLFYECGELKDINRKGLKAFYWFLAITTTTTITNQLSQATLNDFKKFWELSKIWRFFSASFWLHRMVQVYLYPNNRVQSGLHTQRYRKTKNIFNANLFFGPEKKAINKQKCET